VPEYKHIKCPKFIRKAETGEMDAISCKICGTVIAERMERPIGFETDRAGNRIKVVAREFVYVPNYMEIRIAFDDGSHHITHGCSACLTANLTPEVLEELHVADQIDSPDGFTQRERDRKPIGVISAKTVGEGGSMKSHKEK
jgi:hypothetical protein